MATRSAKSTPKPRGQITRPAEAVIVRRKAEARTIAQDVRAALSRDTSNLTPAEAMASKRRDFVAIAHNLQMAQRDALEDRVRPLVPKAIRRYHAKDFWDNVVPYLRDTMQMPKSEFEHLTDADLVAHLERLNAQSERGPRTRSRKRVGRPKTQLECGARRAWLDKKRPGFLWKELQAETGLAYNTLKRFASEEKTTRDSYVKGKLAKGFGCEISEVPA